MRYGLVRAVIVCATVGIIGRFTWQTSVQPNQKQPDGSMLLPNGWKLNPAGRHVALRGDLPIKFCFTNDNKQLVVLTAGYHDHELTLINLQDESITDRLGLGAAWAGLAIDGDQAIVSGGARASRVVNLQPKLERLDTVPVAPTNKGAFIGGVVKLGTTTYFLETGSDLLHEKTDTADRTIKLGYRPYSIAKSPDNKTLAITNWGGSSISYVDLATFQETKRLDVGQHPNEIVWANDGRIFVSCASSDAVSVIRNQKVVETIRTRVEPRDVTGATPVAIALSPDSKTLYVANADANCVAVVDVSGRESRVKGFIPTGWYPTAVAVTPDGKRLVVGVGKGMNFAANSPAKTNLAVKLQDGKKFDYIGSVLNGWVSFVDVPNESQLSTYTAQVRKLRPQVTEPSRGITGALTHINHVIYVIRENRTYDQVLGDLGYGNGDPELTLFGEQVTPNAHKLAREFVTLDNLYCNGEVSEDGHQWCNAAIATDFTQKAWTNSYSGRTEPVSDDRLTASPAGYIWDMCRKHKLSYRSYGEFSSFRSTPDREPEFTGDKGLEGHASADWKGARDYEKIDVFINDLHKAETSGGFPNFTVMSLGEDHTRGLAAGAFTPFAAVASNDVAIGKLVDAVSHSKFWSDTAIFIIEDDAQNGPDHVDAHRTVGFVISPYTKRHVVDSSHYTTASMLRTMEICLGLPPMTEFDKRANPMSESFNSNADATPYTLVAAQTDLNAKNPRAGQLAKESAMLDFSDYDKADPNKLNSILWRALKPGKPMPAPVRSSASATDH